MSVIETESARERVRSDYHRPLEKPGIARLDRATEDALYSSYRAYFAAAEKERRWSPWTDMPWDESFVPSERLISAVADAYREDLFLPDYSAKALVAMRASRGRSWFLTHWSYEKGKELVAFSEWLLRSHAFNEESLRIFSDEMLVAYVWAPPGESALDVLADMLLWEMYCIQRNRGIKTLAEQEGDLALTRLLEFVLADQNAAETFFRDSLRRVAAQYPQLVSSAIEKIANEYTQAARQDGLVIPPEILERFSTSLA